jgi:phosphotransferase system HPr (HPr) family protein
MNIGILLIAHAPLASALRDCVLHVYPELADAVLALDVAPNEAPETTRLAAAAHIARFSASDVLVLTDVFGATPCNVAQKVVDGIHSKLVAGVNLPMLLRTVHSTTTIINNLGLHARASAKLSKLAGSFPCEVWISKGERRVNAKSIMGVMMLAAGYGHRGGAGHRGRTRARGHGCHAGPDCRQFGEGE